MQILQASLPTVRGAITIAAPADRVIRAEADAPEAQAVPADLAAPEAPADLAAPAVFPVPAGKADHAARKAATAKIRAALLKTAIRALLPGRTESR